MVKCFELHEGYCSYECYAYVPRFNNWTHITNLPQAMSYLASVGEGTSLYVAGGRYPDNREANKWIYTGEVWRYSGRNKVWKQLPTLPTPTCEF